MAGSIASAYVQILPSFTGGASAIQKEIDGPLGKAGEEGGKRYGTGMASGIAGMAKNVFAPLLGAAAVFGAGRFLSGAVGEASGLNESVNALNVSYGDASAGIQDLGKKAAGALGLSNLEFNNLAVRFSSFSKTIAGDGGDVTGTLDDLTTRASDFASVMNLDVNEAAQLFQSGLAGESEPLRKFGIDMSAASVEAYGLANGLAANGTSLTESEKIQARYGLLMQQTAATQGDFSNTSDELANKQRITAAEFDNVKARIGAGLLPVMSTLVGFVGSTVLPALSSFGDFFTTRIVPALSRFGGYITGTIIPAIGSFIGWLQQNQAWLAPIAVGIGAIVAAFQIYQGVLAVIRVATAAYAVVQGVLNAVMMANPIGLIILAIVGLVAALIYAWNNSETFRAIVMAAWEGIKSAALAVADWFTTTVPALWNSITSWTSNAWNGIVNFFSAIPGKILAFFLNWTLPGLLIKNWDAIREGASSMLENVVEFFRSLPGRAIDAIGDLAGTLKAKGKALIQGLIEGIMDKIGAIKDVMGNVARAIGDFLPGSPVKEGPLKKWNDGRAGKLLVGMLADGLGQTAEVDAAMNALTSRIAIPGMGADLSLSGGGANGRPGAGSTQGIDYERLAMAMSSVTLGLNGRVVSQQVGQEMGSQWRR